MTDLTPTFASHLRFRLKARPHTAATDARAQRAAVAVIVSEESAPALLLVKRIEREGDPWSGHVAFPGGFVSTGDTSLEDTACRETEEETGLELARLGERLGRLDDVAPRTPLLPPIIVTPIVYLVQGRPAVGAGPEVEAAIWVPVNAILDADNRRALEVPLPTGTRAFESIQTHGLTIWGLTERIIAQLQ